MRLIALTRKEFRQLLRDRSNLASGLALPVVLILLFGFGVSLDIRNAPVAVVREDRSPTVTDVLSGMQGSPYLASVNVGSMPEAEALMRARAVDAIVRIPSDFSSQFADGHGTIQVILYGPDPNIARAVQGYVTGALSESSLRNADRRANRAGLGDAATIGFVTVEARQWFNEANTSTWYLVPGLIVLIMTFVGSFLTSLVVAREWERGTLEALFVTPVKPVEILLAKLIPYFAVGMVGFSLCLLAARFLFGVPIVGSVVLVLLSSVLYMIVVLGMGLLISAATKNQFLASQTAILVGFLPAVMLSGFLFDLHNVPQVIRIVGLALPATHFLDLIKTQLLAGNVWSVILPQWVILIAYAVFFFAAATRVTPKRLG